jgi:hypothetical protein
VDYDSQHGNRGLLSTPPRKRSRAQSYNPTGESCNLLHPKYSVRATVAILLKLGVRIFWFLGLPGKWTLQFLRLFLFVLMLMPAFLKGLMNFRRGAFGSEQTIKTNVVYGDSFRNQLDIYMPCTAAATVAGAAAEASAAASAAAGGQKQQGSVKSPVVIFVCGGAWIIGYKFWAFLMVRDWGPITRRTLPLTRRCHGTPPPLPPPLSRRCHGTPPPPRRASSCSGTACCSCRWTTATSPR